MTPLTYNIAMGIELSILAYVIIKAGTGRYKEISKTMLVNKEFANMINEIKTMKMTIEHIRTISIDKSVNKINTQLDKIFNQLCVIIESKLSLYYFISSI